MKYKLLFWCLLIFLFLLLLAIQLVGNYDDRQKNDLHNDAKERPQRCQAIWTPPTNTYTSTRGLFSNQTRS